MWLFIKGDVFIGERGIFGAEVFLHYRQFFIIGRVECNSQEERLLGKLIPTPHPRRQEFGEYGFSVQIWTFHSILAKQMVLEKPTSNPPVRDDGLKNITFLNRFAHIMQFLTFFGEVTSPPPYWTRGTTYS